MLRNIDPLLTGELLALLDDMGHGDVLALVDRNFPSRRYGAPVVDLRGVGVEAAARAILSVFPLDSFVEQPIRRMEVDGAPDERHAVTQALQSAADEVEGRPVGMASVGRLAFYDECAGAYAFVQTGETTGFSCYLLRKGVV